MAISSGLRSWRNHAVGCPEATRVNGAISRPSSLRWVAKLRPWRAASADSNMAYRCAGSTRPAPISAAPTPGRASPTTESAALDDAAATGGCPVAPRAQDDRMASAPATSATSRRPAVCSRRWWSSPPGPARRPSGRTDRRPAMDPLVTGSRPRRPDRCGGPAHEPPRGRRGRPARPGRSGQPARPARSPGPRPRSRGPVQGRSWREHPLRSYLRPAMIHSASSMAARPNQSAATVHRSRAKPTTRPMTSHATPSSPKSHRCQRRRLWRLPGACGPLGDTTRQPYAPFSGAYLRARRGSTRRMFG